MLLEIFDEFLLDFIHFVDLRPPFIELLGQYVDHAITIDMPKVILDADLAQVAVMLDAEVRAVLLVVVAVAGVGAVEVGGGGVVHSCQAITSMVDFMDSMQVGRVCLSTRRRDGISYLIIIFSARH